MRDSTRGTPLWLSHHWPEDYQRCVRVGDRHVCRRCLVLYPVAALIAVAVALLAPPAHLLVAAMWLLPAPMALDWILEHTGVVHYSARRQTALTALGAPALGVALGIHAQHPFSIAALAPVAFWLLLCLIVAVTATAGSTRHDHDWEARHDAEEAVRHERLARLLDADEQLRSPG